MTSAVHLSMSAVEHLVGSLQQMAAQQTNPVLEVVGDSIHQLRMQQKYPQPALSFHGDDWRAFYHCHALPDSDLVEHGHFHLFTRYQQQWLHVAALSMDQQGQPQAWMAVNRWVTDGPWLAASSLQQHLRSAEYDYQGLSLVEYWLLGMLQLYSTEIATLLIQRDTALRQINKNPLDPVLLNNHAIYTLAIQPIDLLAKLKQFYSESEAGGAS